MTTENKYTALMQVTLGPYHAVCLLVDNDIATIVFFAYLHNNVDVNVSLCEDFRDLISPTIHLAISVVYDMFKKTFYPYSLILHFDSKMKVSVLDI